MSPDDRSGPRTPENAVNRNFRATYSLHVQEVGEGLPTLVLVHGFGGSAHYWRKWVPELARRYRTKVVDLLGFGRSPAPKGADYSPEGQAARVAELLAGSGSPPDRPDAPVLVGHSLGAAIVLLATLALMDRQRGQPPVSGLVLMSPAVYRQTLPRYVRLLRTPGAGDLIRLAAPPHRAMAEGIRGIMAPGARADAAIADPGMVEGYLAPFRSSAHRAAIIDAARQMDLDGADRLASRLGEIAVPTLVLWGEEDRIVVPALAARLTADLPNARGLGIPGVGHLPIEEASGEFLEPTLAFLASLGTDHPGSPTAPRDA